MEATIEAVKRETFGKNEARRLRASGRIPAVLYGATGDDRSRAAVPIAVEPKALMRILHSESGANTLIELKLDDLDVRVMVKEYQVDPIDHRLLHADFYRVAMDRAIVVTVPIVVKGEARGVKQQGGLLDFVQRDVQVECLPADIPENLEVDVSELMLGQAVRLRDLVTDVKWKPISDPDTMLVHVIMPKAVAEPEPAADAVAAAPAEPEVIKKGKVEKEEEEK
jgi:large subunit ribosomal protein L25